MQFTTATGTTVTSVAYAACAAGLTAPAEADAISSSGSLATVNGVSASVVLMVPRARIKRRALRSAFVCWVCGARLQGF